MGVQRIDDIIIKELKNHGMFKANLIVDGQYSKVAGKRVYVRLTDANQLIFFIRKSDSEKSSSDEVRLTGYHNKLAEAVTGNIFCDTELTLYTTLNEVSCTAISSSSTIVIESGWYKIGKMLQDQNQTISIGGINLPTTEAEYVRKAFLKKARKDYLDIAYGNSIIAAIRRLSKSNKLYTLKPTAFVPIFIDISYLYNPFKVEDSPLKNTAIYKYGVQHDRIVSDGIISAMFLTHYEISKLLGLHNLVRFKHSTWATLFFGAYLGYEATELGLPRKGAFVYRWMPETHQPSPFERVYSENDFKNVAQMIYESYGSDIELYKKVDSVDSFLMDEYSSFRTVGSLPIDGKIERDQILKYFASFEILWEVNI